MNEKLLMLNCLKFYHTIHDTTTSVNQQVPCTHRLLHLRLIAC